MQKGSLLLCVASLGIAWVHASTTSSGYCCPQITVALGTEDDGTYNFLTEGNGPAMEQCQDACIYSKDSNKTDIYCFQAVTSEELGSGQVQCEAVSPYSLLMSTTPAVTGPTTEDLLKKIEDLQKEVDSIDGRLNKTEKRTAVCGYKNSMSLNSGSWTILTFERVNDEVNSGGKLETNGRFTAQVEGVYLVTLKYTVALGNGEYLGGYLHLSSGLYQTDNEDRFIFSENKAGGSYIQDQASATRYVKMAAGDFLHISFDPHGVVEVHMSMLCVSLYSASG